MKKTMVAFCCILLAVTGCKKEKTLEEAMADIPEEIQYKLDNNICDEEVMEFDKKYYAGIAECDSQFRQEFDVYKTIWSRDKESDPFRTVQLDSTIDGETYTMSYTLKDVFYTRYFKDIEIPEGYYERITEHNCQNGETIGDDLLMVFDMHIENISGKTIPLYRGHQYDSGAGVILDDKGVYYRNCGEGYDSFQPGDKTDTMYFTMYDYPDFESGTGIDVRYAAIVPQIYTEKANVCLLIENNGEIRSSQMDKDNVMLLNLRGVVKNKAEQ